MNLLKLLEIFKKHKKQIEEAIAILADKRVDIIIEKVKKNWKVYAALALLAAAGAVIIGFIG